MPIVLRTISFSTLAATTLTLAVIVFGPQGNLGTLSGGLLAYFTLVFHIANAPAYLYQWYTARRVSLGLGAMLC